MKLFVGADHAGFELKEKIKPFLSRLGYEVVDLGNKVYDRDDDYPVFGFRVAEEVVRHRSKGIVFCGSAEGVCIAANKVRGVRAVAVRDVRLAKLSREHNDANVLCLAGGGTRQKVKGLGLSLSAVKNIIKVWLSTPFSRALRHSRRIRKISSYERKMFK